ncbi:MAG: hypothetical protein K2X08_02510, partial [Chlamydiales bacterium]|nr:hypothetical protein [Chlamydiales bacterium]
ASGLGPPLQEIKFERLLAISANLHLNDYSHLNVNLQILLRRLSTNFISWRGGLKPKTRHRI